MRASRLLSIQMLLQTRGRMPAHALASLLEVSVRTLYRDVDELSAAGVPIYAERGRAGGFQLREGWKTSLTGLTPSESQAVFLTGLAGPAAQLGLGPQVQSARLKLLAALPAEGRDDSQRISQRLHLDPVDWYREAEPVPHLGTVAQAVWQGQLLTMRYESWHSTQQRTVGPLGLVLKAGTWYVVALLRGQPRTFRVAQVQQASLLPTPVQRPPGFDLAAHWQASILAFERGRHPGQATVLATAEGLRGLRQINSALALAVASARPSDRPDGRVAVQLPIESVDHAAAQLMALSSDVEVITPVALRRALLQRLEQMAALYGQPALRRRRPRPRPST